MHRQYRMELRRLHTGNRVQERLVRPSVLKGGTHLALQPGTRGHHACLVGKERIVLAPQSCKVLPSRCLQRWIFRLETAGQEPVARSLAVTLQCAGQWEIWALEPQGKAIQNPPVSPGGSPCRKGLGAFSSFTLAAFSGAVTHTQPLQPEKVAHTPWQCHIPACWARAEGDGMKSHCCPLAPAVAPTLPARQRAPPGHGSLPKPRLPPPRPPAAIPRAQSQRGPGAASSPGAAASRAARPPQSQEQRGEPALCPQLPRLRQGQSSTSPALLGCWATSGNKQHQGQEFQGNDTDPRPQLHPSSHSSSMPG